MLHAILNSKAGSVPLSEDLLTAGLFGRMRYLSDELQGHVMHGLLGEAATQLGGLQDLAFWPTYRLQGSHQQRVTPDAVLRFAGGTVVVEVKHPLRGAQAADQWTRELDAAVQAELDAPIHLLALGGNSLGNTAGFDASRWQVKVQLHTREWPDLAHHLAALHERAALPSDQAVLADWLALLALYSLRPRQHIDLLPLRHFAQQQRPLLDGMAQWLRMPTASQS